MKVEISKTFRVSAPLGDVWNFMTNVEKVSTCIPGAQYMEDLGGNKHSVMLVVKVGPIKSTYRGEVFIRSMDEENQVIEIDGKGTDMKGKGGANMKLIGSIIDKGEGQSPCNFKNTFLSLTSSNNAARSSALSLPSPSISKVST